MGLQSRLFRGDPKLEAAAVSDPAHIMLGASGPHVQKIQTALILLDGTSITADELQRTFYGASTATAVLAYKQKRNIINRSYQTQADNIVGKMTMASLDSEMLKREIIPHAPVRIKPRSFWRVRPPRSPSLFSSRPFGLNVALGFSAIGGPGVLPIELKISQLSDGFFEVIDGSPGRVEIIGPPIVKIQPLGNFLSPGDSFPVTDNPQFFKILGLQSGTTTIAATLELKDFSSQAFLDVTVESQFPTLKGRIESAPDKALGFDTDAPVSLAIARQFVAHQPKFQFCLRYLAFGPNQGKGDLTRSEANDILDAGLALMPVQHPRNPGWLPTGALGTSDGFNAVKNAESVGFPIGMNVWVDLEGVAATSSIADVIAYCSNWANQVQTAGYRPGIYVGSNSLLISSARLFELPFLHYWKAGGSIPPVATQGFQMIQTIANEHLFGIPIDRDKTQTDQLGGQVQWLIR
jgi:Domain of unknown function (DUF1906)